ncbi:MAG: caspase family protein [Muribaculaceae bacterium]|nr:caspase family protein [Muribaculaceae bacterium]
MWVFACAIPTTAVADNLGIDSIESEVSAIPNIENAVNLYKRVKDVQFSGAEDDEYYPIVIDAFKEAYAVILEAESDSVIDQCKGILIDLNSTLARGAIYYSSNGKSSEMSEFAKAYVDTQLLPQMLGVEFRRDKDLYPALVYCAASGSYNSGDIDGAIKYFEEYLATGETKQREQVSLFYGQAILNKKLYSQGTEAIVNASNEYPSNYNLLTIALQLCIDGKRRDLLAPLVERALEIKPDDEKLLNLQASVYEDSHNYRGALDIYMRLQEKHPNSLSVNECVARCYYNLGTGYYNKSISELDQKELAKLRRQSNAYFSSAAEKYEELTANDPNNIKYLKAMATSYACLGNKSKVESINIRLAALGQPTMAMNTMPVIMGNGTTKVNETTGPRNIPSYQEYALEYVRTHLKDWMKRGEFEKAEDYERRISRDNMRQEQERLSSIIADKYLKTYANQLAISELKLQPYDVDNETYAVNSDFGTVVINVPLNNHEAELFKTNWDEIKIKNPKFFIKHDNIAIESITFITPDGKEYAYNAADRNQYESDKVVHVDISDLFDKPTKTPNNNAQKNGTTYVATIKSDVDKNIPQTSLVNDLTIALIIANENYNKVVPVSSANHDGEVFAQYCKETLGIPDNQVFLYKDATYGETLSAINKLRNSVKALGGNVDLIVYYAGHGVPDEKTSDAYMMPIDADPMVMATAYPLNQFYKELNSMGAANIMVFLDACFSGANRGDGMLAEARGVVLVSKQAPPEGNMFVLSAADGKETALPYKEKNHGLFTYFLLKKLQESNGNATLKEISDYVTHNVQKTSSLTLNKPQNPKLTVGGTLQNAISKKKLRP